MARKTNPFGRTRPQDDAYAIYVNNAGWTWYVVKTYHHPDNEDGYSRWFCYVSSPMTHGGFDLGDVYQKDVLENARLVSGTDEWIGNYSRFVHGVTV